MFEGNWIIWVMLIVVVGIFIFMRFGRIKGVQNLNAEQFAKQLETGSDYMLVDVREPNEFKAGHIRGAKNIPLSQIREHLTTVSTKERLLIYCQSGMRSRQAARLLSNNGFANIVNLQGGIISWHGEKVK